MFRFDSLQLAGASLLSLMLLAGCDNGGQPSHANKPAGKSPAAVEEHAEHGPHDGDLVELGNEEYHAEIVHGKAGQITIYVLDDKAAKAVPIEASEIVINLSHDGKAEQFKLPAAALKSDPSGQSSRFALKDPELASDLDAESTSAKLVVMINGKSYTGKIEHHHDDKTHGDAHK